MKEHEIKVALEVSRKVSIASQSINSIRYAMFDMDSLYLEHKMLISIVEMLDSIEQSVTEKMNMQCVIDTVND